DVFRLIAFGPQRYCQSIWAVMPHPSGLGSCGWTAPEAARLPEPPPPADKRRILTGTVREVLAASRPRSETSGVTSMVSVEGMSSRTFSAAMSPLFETVNCTWKSEPGY